MERGRDPRFWTVGFVASLQGPTSGLAVSCERCRCLREVDLTALMVAGRGKQEVRKLRFRCSVCSSPGVPLVSWWNQGNGSYNYATDEVTGELPE